MNDQAINLIKKYVKLFPRLSSSSPNLGLICVKYNDLDWFEQISPQHDYRCATIRRPFGCISGG